MDDTLDIVGRLQMAATDAIHPEAEAAILEAIDIIANLEAENFALAAGSCDVEGGKIGDERGHFHCTLQARVTALEGALRKIEAAPAWGYPEKWETTPAEVRQIARQALGDIP